MSTEKQFLLTMDGTLDRFGISFEDYFGVLSAGYVQDGLENKGWKVITHEENGYAGKIYYNEATNKAIFITQGTFFGSKEAAFAGLNSDTKIASGTIPRIHVSGGIDLMKKFEDTIAADKSKKFEDFEFMFTGHSLGGATAQLMSDLYVVSYNGAPQPTHLSVEQPGVYFAEKELLEKIAEHTGIDLETLTKHVHANVHRHIFLAADRNFVNGGAEYGTMPLFLVQGDTTSLGEVAKSKFFNAQENWLTKTIDTLAPGFSKQISAHTLLYFTTAAEKPDFRMQIIPDARMRKSDMISGFWQALGYSPAQRLDEGATAEHYTAHRVEKEHTQISELPNKENSSHIKSQSVHDEQPSPKPQEVQRDESKLGEIPKGKVREIVELFQRSGATGVTQSTKAENQTTKTSAKKTGQDQIPRK